MNKTFEIEGGMRDEIVRFLRTQVVPAQVGAGLVQVADLLAQLKEVKQDDKKDERKIK